jgi:hypothetical protein
MTDNFMSNLTRMDRFCLRNGSVTDEEDDLHRQTQVFVLEIQSMKEVTARVYLVSINRSRYSAVSGGVMRKRLYTHVWLNLVLKYNLNLVY